MKVKSVCHIQVGTPVPVYDITTEMQHNFFAEGVLVHNCA